MKRNRPVTIPPCRGLCSRVDLLLSQMQSDELCQATARILGFEPVAAEAESRSDDKQRSPDSRPKDESSTSPQPRLAAGPLGRTPFWYPASYELRDEEKLKPRETSIEAVAWVRDRRLPRAEPLCPWRELRTRLRPILSVLQEGHGVDADALVRRLSCGRQIEVIPRPRLTCPHVKNAIDLWVFEEI